MANPTRKEQELARDLLAIAKALAPQVKVSGSNLSVKQGGSTASLRLFTPSVVSERIARSS